MRIAVEPVLDVLPARWSELCQMACYDLRDPLIEEISTGKLACRERSSRLPPILGGLRRNGSNALVRDARLRSSKKFNFLAAWNRASRQENRLNPIKLHSQKSAEMRRIAVLKDSGGHSRSPASSTGTQ